LFFFGSAIATIGFFMERKETANESINQITQADKNQSELSAEADQEEPCPKLSEQQPANFRFGLRG
jgi:hypothetical protein